jgi:hypothetical protein
MVIATVVTDLISLHSSLRRLRHGYFAMLTAWDDAFVNPHSTPAWSSPSTRSGAPLHAYFRAFVVGYVAVPEFSGFATHVNDIDR